MTALSAGNKTSSCGIGGWVGPVFKKKPGYDYHSAKAWPQNAVNITRPATTANT